MRYIILGLCACLSTELNAQELEHSSITACNYQAGTAREIQTIRQNEGDDWAEFEQKVMQIYKESQGREDLLVIAKTVYQKPVEALPDSVYSDIFDACVVRIQAHAADTKS